AGARGAAERGLSLRSSDLPTHLVGDGDHEEESDGEGKQPPPVDAVVGTEEDGADRDDGADRKLPVVTDEEVVPELPELREPLHDAVISGASSRADLRTNATRPNERATTNAISPISARSAPGQVTPAPSALQKIPNAVSITPTPN